MKELYEHLADEFLATQMELLQVPLRRQMVKLNRGEQFVLHYLFTHKRVAHPGEISRSMAVSTARIAALLGTMEQKGLVTRSVDPTDNRQIIVTLLPSGIQAIESIRNKVRKTLVDILQQLGPEDAQEYLRIQRKILSLKK